MSKALKATHKPRTQTRYSGQTTEVSSSDSTKVPLGIVVNLVCFLSSLEAFGGQGSHLSEPYVPHHEQRIIST